MLSRHGYNMTTPRTGDNAFRLHLRIVLKLLSLVGLVLAVMVSLRYLGGTATDPSPSSVRVALAEIAPGEVRRVGLGNRAVIVLHRSPDVREHLRAAGHADTDAAWFVAWDRGTDRGCSLVWEAARAGFREVCGDARYDAAGRSVGDAGLPPLPAPPHHVDSAAGIVVIGRDD